MQLCFSLSPQQTLTKHSARNWRLCHLSRLQPRSPSYIPLHKKAPATSQGDTSNPRRVEAGLPKPHTPHAFRKPTNTKEIKPLGVQALLSALFTLPSLFKRPLARAVGTCSQFHPFSSEKLAYLVLSEKIEDEWASARGRIVSSNAGSTAAASGRYSASPSQMLT